MSHSGGIAGLISALNSGNEHITVKNDMFSNSFTPHREENTHMEKCAEETKLKGGHFLGRLDLI